MVERVDYLRDTSLPTKYHKTCYVKLFRKHSNDAEEKETSQLSSISRKFDINRCMFCQTNSPDPISVVTKRETEDTILEAYVTHPTMSRPLPNYIYWSGNISSEVSCGSGKLTPGIIAAEQLLACFLNESFICVGWGSLLTHDLQNGALCRIVEDWTLH